MYEDDRACREEFSSVPFFRLPFFGQPRKVTKTIICVLIIDNYDKRPERLLSPAYDLQLLDLLLSTSRRPISTHAAHAAGHATGHSA